MFNSLIFTKNRASQLRLLLESIKKNADGIFNINVLYKHTTDEFKKGYDKLREENILPNITWIEETSFKEQVVKFLDSDYEFSLFFTDDDIIYNPIKNKEEISKAFEDDDLLTFSLRLGLNTKFCYMLNCDNVLIPLEQKEKAIIWDWTKHFSDSAYPLSVDGHIFKTEDIKNFSKNINYNNPNSYEGALQIFDNFPKYKMAAFLNSCLVNTPINMVQNVFENNRQGDKYGIKPEELNTKYLNDEIIDFEKLDFSNIIGCHQEIPFIFKNNKS